MMMRVPLAVISAIVGSYVGWWVGREIMIFFTLRRMAMRYRNGH